MRIMARICIPVESGNKSIQDGSLPKVIQQTAERWHPEAMYFTTFDGRRTAYVVLDLPDSSALVEFAEPPATLAGHWKIPLYVDERGKLDGSRCPSE